ncbi:MAG: FAD-dependent thymidylate synthase [Lachnospiraceae bacterium]|nr:FAD-dependent thymidylate synthase [Lachnospiraceae bacterium]
MILEKARFELIDPPDYQELLKKIEYIGRVCYKSEDKIAEGSAERFIGNIVKRGHESVIEHGSITVKFICDRGVSHELVRHRIASYSQESTRYCNYSKDKYGNQISCIDIATGFEYNLEDETDRKKFLVWQEAMEYAEKKYFELLALGASPQEARSVLPNSLKTEVAATLDIRSWRNLLRLRTAKAAHPQFRELACALLEELSARYPVFFEDLAESEE